MQSAPLVLSPHGAHPSIRPAPRACSSAFAMAPLGEHSQDAPHAVRWQVQQAHAPQGLAIQGRQALCLCSGYVAVAAPSLWRLIFARAPPHTQCSPSRPLGKRRYDRKQAGYGGQTKPVFHKKAKTTKKVVLRLECSGCKHKHQLVIKRCKHFELGGDKKSKVCGARAIRSALSFHSPCTSPCISL